MRVVQNRKASEKHYRRIDEVKPKTGVCLLYTSDAADDLIGVVLGGRRMI